MKKYFFASAITLICLLTAVENGLAQTAYNQQATDALTAAALANDTTAALEALSKGANPNATYVWNGIKQFTPLLNAAQKGNIELATALIKAGANVNVVDGVGFSPLNRSTFFYSIGQNGIEILQLLLKAGADVNHVDGNGSTTLDSVADQQGLDESLVAIEILVRAGAKLEVKDRTGGTALISAAHGGTIDGVRALLAAGADPNAADNFGYTALTYAVRSNGFGLMKAWLLIKAGAQTTDAVLGEKTRDYGASVEAVRRMAAFAKGSTEAKLFDAVADNNASELAALLDANPSVDKTIFNYLLMMSVWNDNAAVMQALVAKGADVDFNLGDDNALKIARIQGRKSAFAFLSDRSTAPPEANFTAQNEAKITELLNNAASAMDFATAQLRKGLEQRNAGREKAYWCMPVNEAANSANASLRYVKQAQAIFTLKYKSVLQEAKEQAEQSLKLTMSQGCPVFLKN